MKSAVDRLVAFIRVRRAELGISQNELARLSGLNPGTLANIMVGRVTKAPSLDTLQKLAHGLRVDAEFLFRVARGEEPRLEVVDCRPTAGKHPLTDEEWETLEEARGAGVTLDLNRASHVLDLPPAERKWLFLGLESLAASLADHSRTISKSG
ncbi:MAG: helix-turn-helix transcriptional regulator [Candidatus Sericytochromatia bacterium]|nr:helix-turn-helix transcriptional regulator [Candidatus Tanganyikabacteria bacterium]